MYFVEKYQNAKSKSVFLFLFTFVNFSTSEKLLIVFAQADYKHLSAAAFETEALRCLSHFKVLLTMRWGVRGQRGTRDKQLHRTVLNGPIISDGL